MKKISRILVIVLVIVALICTCFGILNNETIYGEEQGTYKIEYYYDQDSYFPSYLVTYAVSGEETKLLTTDKLDYTKDGYIFEGWRLNRSSDNKWYLRDPKGKNTWYELDNGELPEGYQYALKKDGAKLISPAKEGTVRLFGQWGGIEFEVLYHLDEESEPSEQTTTVSYGVATPMLTLDELGFAKDGKTFKGWKLYREIDGKWRVKSTEGKGSWGSLEKGKPKEGYRFSLFADGQELIKAATSGIVHAYAQWK